MPFTLSYIADKISTGMALTEDRLTAAIDGVGTGESISVPAMVDLQYEMTNYTISASLQSSIIKEVSDTMKSVVQKIS